LRHSLCQFFALLLECISMALKENGAYAADEHET
jgi:hypothetical protein